jgi:hypothetical protein
MQALWEDELMSASSEALFEQMQELSARIEAADVIGGDTASLRRQLETLREQHSRAQRILTEDRKTALLRD